MFVCISVLVRLGRQDVCLGASCCAVCGIAWQTACPRAPLDARTFGCEARLAASRLTRCLHSQPLFTSQQSAVCSSNILHSNVFAPHVKVDPALQRQLEASQASIGETMRIC